MPTAWSSSGSLVSDRLRPHPPPPKQQQQNNSKGKGKASTPDPPKSKAVRALEARLDGVRGSDGHAKDPKGGCFCQARKHALSSYVPMCRRCGLILCALDLPHHACPHCAAPLLDSRGREALAGRLEGELADRLAWEEVGRQKAIEEARAAEGAFPMLPGLQPAQTARTTRTPSPATRTVLSLNSDTKRVTVSSYSAPVASRGQDKEEQEEQEERVPGPLRDVVYVREPPDPRRPWKNSRAGDVKYVRPAAGTTGGASKQEQQRKG